MNDYTPEQLRTLLEFADATSWLTELHKLLGTSVEFFVKKFRLNNCTILALDHKARYYTNSSALWFYEAVESIAFAYLKENRSPVFIPSLKNDVLFKGVKGAERFEGSAAFLPLVYEKQFVGGVVMYADEPLDSFLTIASAVCAKLAKASVMLAHYNQVRECALTDALTGLYNRAYFAEALKTEISRASKEKKPTSLLMFDIDNFKQFNDTKGHPAGDELLKKISALCKNCLSQENILCRYGGEEFVAILPNTRTEEAFETAERLRNAVAKNAELTISIGVVSCLNSSVSAETMLKEADTALYKAKNSGKNKTVSFVIVDKSIGTIDVREASSVGKA